MPFGFSGWVSNNADTSVDMAYPSYTNILGTGSKSSWQNVLGALSADAYGLFVQVAKTATSATDTSAVLDIGVDTAGGSSYTAKVSDLLVGFADDTNANNGNGGMQQYLLPIKIASGSTVAIRGQTVRGAAQSASVRVAAYLASSGPLPGTSNCTTYGVSGTTGTSVTPGNGAWGSWTNIGSTLAANTQAIVLGVQCAGATVSRDAFRLEIGVSSAAISGEYVFKTSTTETAHGPSPAIPTYYYVASGTQLQVRARSTGSSGDTLRVALYTFDA